jgi:hypothetical protein
MFRFSNIKAGRKVHLCKWKETLIESAKKNTASTCADAVKPVSSCQ